MNTADQTDPTADRPAVTSSAPGPAPAAPADVLALLRRIDRLLAEIRGAVDTVTREQRHKQFSPLRLLGAVLQVIVVGLVGLAVLDCLFGAAYGPLLTKLAFAVVLQLGVLTTCIVATARR